MWWTLPGPRRFVERVAQDVREGRNVVLCLPRHLPDGLTRAVRANLADGWTWSTVPVEPADGQDPIRQVYDLIVGAVPPGQLRNMATLLQEPAYVGQIVWLTGLDRLSWPAWRSFLSDYQHACRGKTPFDRVLFCVPLEGEIALSPPPEDVCLARHRWDAVVDHLDMTLFAAELVRDRQLSSVQRRLAVAMAVNLAVWDPELAERLLAETMARICQPEPILREFATDRGWDAGLFSDEHDGWQAGAALAFDDSLAWHSAAVWADAALGGIGEIERRLWSAQVGVMFPYVEEQRRAIIERWGRAFRIPHVPYIGAREVINDVRDLEIGHLAHQVEHLHVHIDPAVKRHIRRLKAIRDQLAHLQTLDASLLASDDLASPRRP